MKKIYYAKPSITDLEIEYVQDAIRTGWGDHCYDYVKKFEATFKKYLNVKHSIATSSCTGALHIALSTVGVKPDDEVLLADINWIASAVPITYLGAKPIFVDVLQDSWCIDPKKMEEAITPKTKAVIVTHLYGNLAEMDEILEIAKKHDLYVIEDAAEAIGSEYKGKKAGSLGHFGTFSFHGTKTITTGEGGMLVTNDEELFKKASILANHGRNPEETRMFWPESIGFKYRLSNLQGAVGLAQTERAEELVSRKREIFNKYSELLSDIKEISLNPEPKDTVNSYWMTTVVFDSLLKISKEAVVNYFQKQNIDVRPFFYPLSSLSMFQEKKSNEVAYGIHSRGINLPCYHDITDDEMQNISRILREIVQKKVSLDGL